MGRGLKKAMFGENCSQHGDTSNFFKMLNLVKNFSHGKYEKFRKGQKKRLGEILKFIIVSEEIDACSSASYKRPVRLHLKPLPGHVFHWRWNHWYHHHHRSISLLHQENE